MFRILLQRIGNILTAAPKLTDEDYVKAKNLHPSLRKGNCLYEESIREQRLKKMKVAFLVQVEQPPTITPPLKFLTILILL